MNRHEIMCRWRHFWYTNPTITATMRRLANLDPDREEVTMRYYVDVVNSILHHTVDALTPHSAAVEAASYLNLPPSSRMRVCEYGQELSGVSNLFRYEGGQVFLVVETERAEVRHDGYDVRVELDLIRSHLESNRMGRVLGTPGGPALPILNPDLSVNYQAPDTIPEVSFTDMELSHRYSVRVQNSLLSYHVNALTPREAATRGRELLATTEPYLMEVVGASNQTHVYRCRDGRMDLMPSERHLEGNRMGRVSGTPGGPALPILSPDLSLVYRAPDTIPEVSFTDVEIALLYKLARTIQSIPPSGKPKPGMYMNEDEWTTIRKVVSERKPLDPASDQARRAFRGSCRRWVRLYDVQVEFFVRNNPREPRRVVLHNTWLEEM